MNNKTETLAEITDNAIRLLCREMGVVKTARFLNQFTNGFGDYTKERQDKPDEMSIDEVVAEVMKRRKQSADESFGIKE